MSHKRILRYHPLIELLVKKKISNDQFKSLIKSLNYEAIKFICECCKNAISKQYVFSMKDKKRTSFLKLINSNSKLIKKLCMNRDNCAQKRKVIIQKGYGIIMPILASVIPLLTSLLTK